MLIISPLLLAISFLTQIAVLAAPIPLNGISLNARALSFNDIALFSRAGEGEGKSGGTHGTFTWIILQHFEPTLESLELLEVPQHDDSLHPHDQGKSFFSKYLVDN